MKDMINVMYIYVMNLEKDLASVLRCLRFPKTERFCIFCFAHVFAVCHIR